MRYLVILTIPDTGSRHEVAVDADVKQNDTAAQALKKIEDQLYYTHRFNKHLHLIQGIFKL